MRLEKLNSALRKQDFSVLQNLILSHYLDYFCEFTKRFRPIDRKIDFEKGRLIIFEKNLKILEK